jgi:hypothetical protein
MTSRKKPTTKDRLDAMEESDRRRGHDLVAPRSPAPGSPEKPAAEPLTSLSVPETMLRRIKRLALDLEERRGQKVRPTYLVVAEALDLLEESLNS